MSTCVNYTDVQPALTLSKSLLSAIIFVHMHFYAGRVKVATQGCAVNVVWQHGVGFSTDTHRCGVCEMYKYAVVIHRKGYRRAAQQFGAEFRGRTETHTFVVLFCADYCYKMWWLASVHSGLSPEEEVLPGRALLSVYDKMMETPLWQQHGGRCAHVLVYCSPEST
jgi:hypothetical protein